MLNLSLTCEKLLESNHIEPYIILEIEGFRPLSSRVIEKYTTGTSGNLEQDETCLPIIDLAGSINSISQQIEQDKGIVSLTSARFRLVDEADIGTSLISAGASLDEILFKKTKLYMALKGGGHPHDSILFFRGIIEGVSSGSGYVELNIVSPDQFKRYDIYNKIESSTAVALNAVNTEVELKNVNIEDIYYTSNGEVQTYIRIDDEIILVRDLNIDNKILNNCVRGQLGTIAAAHDADASVQTFYRLQGNAIDLALKTMLSNGFGEEISRQNIVGFNTDGVNTVLNSIYLTGQDLNLSLNFSVGDYLTVFNSFGFLGYNLKNARIKSFANNIAQNTFRIDLDATVGTTALVANPVTAVFYKRTSFAELNTVGFNTDGTNTLANHIFFAGITLRDEFNFNIGDTITTTGAVNVGNNFYNGTIQSYTIFPNTETIAIKVNQTLVTELISANAKMFSQYNTLDKRASLSMQPYEVDIARHQEILNIYGNEIFTMDLYLKDTINGNDLINVELYRPSGLNPIPRNAQASVSKVVKPLGSSIVSTFDKTNLINPSKIKSTRNISNYFYNTSTYKYDEDSITDEFLGTEKTVSVDSLNRIKINKEKPYEIKARGIRSTPDPTNIMQTINAKLLERYQYGAEIWEVETTFGAGFRFEVGDVVVLDGTDLNMSDTLFNKGTRNFKGYYCEIIQAQKQIKSAKCNFKLINTGFTADYRYGVISPSSVIGSGSNTTLLNLTESYSTSLYAGFTEDWKWRNYIGQYIVVRNDDYSFFEKVLITGVGYNFLTISALSIAPSAGYIVEIPPYPTNNSKEDMKAFKRTYTFLDPTIDIVSATINTITVSALDIGKVHVGSEVIAHDNDWTYKTNRVKVKTIFGNTLNLEADLTSLPLAGHKIDLIGFNDGGAPYVWS